MEKLLVRTPAQRSPAPARGADTARVPAGRDQRDYPRTPPTNTTNLSQYNNQIFDLSKNEGIDAMVAALRERDAAFPEQTKGRALNMFSSKYSDPTKSFRVFLGENIAGQVAAPTEQRICYVDQNNMIRDQRNNNYCLTGLQVTELNEKTLKAGIQIIGLRPFDYPPDNRLRDPQIAVFFTDDGKVKMEIFKVQGRDENGRPIYGAEPIFQALKKVAVKLVSDKEKNAQQSDPNAPLTPPTK